MSGSCTGSRAGSGSPVSEKRAWLHTPSPGGIFCGREVGGAIEETEAAQEPSQPAGAAGGENSGHRANAGQQGGRRHGARENEEGGERQTCTGRVWGLWLAGLGHGAASTLKGGQSGTCYTWPDPLPCKGRHSWGGLGSEGYSYPRPARSIL